MAITKPLKPKNINVTYESIYKSLNKNVQTLITQVVQTKSLNFNRLTTNSQLISYYMDKYQLQFTPAFIYSIPTFYDKLNITQFTQIKTKINGMLSMLAISIDKDNYYYILKDVSGNTIGIWIINENVLLVDTNNQLDDVQLLNYLPQCIDLPIL